MCNPAPETLYPKCSKQSLASLCVFYIFELVLKHTGLLTFDTDDESHTAHNMNFIDNGTLAKADPHLTVEVVPAKSYRAEAGWVQDAEVRRSSDIGGLNGYLTTLTGGDFASTFL